MALTPTLSRWERGPERRAAAWTWLILAVLASTALAEDHFIEAESSPDHTFNEPGEFQGLVSGERILRLWKGEDPPADGWFARYPFEIAGAGGYYVWLAASLPPSTSNFWWRLDDGEWRHFTPETIDGFPAMYGVSSVMAWVELGAAPLTAGKHTFQVKVNERRDTLEKAYLVYLDALLITDRDVYPRGLVIAADVPKLSPRPVPPPPVQRAGKPGPPMLMGTSVMGARQNKLVRELGFSLSQTDSDHLTVNETAPGQWDWTAADAGLASCQDAGLEWQYFPHFHWPPEWYRKSDKFVPCTGLRTGRKLACMSLWSPDILPWFDHGFAALAEHYGSDGKKLAAIYVGIHGDFGEAIFPMGWHPGEKERFGETGVGLPDFWCGDEPARADFRQAARAKYGDLAKLNAAWGTTFASFDVVDYPPCAYKNEDVTATPQSRRRWLDFVAWYFDSMTHFTAEVCRLAHERLPGTRLVLPVGGGEEAVVYAQDNSAIPKAVKPYGVEIRSTHGGYLPFAQNYASMLRRINTACKVYGLRYWSEPPGNITPDGEVARIMEEVSCGSYGYWDWGSNPVAAADVFREYKAFLTQEQPVVDVALFFPSTDHRLHPTVGYPGRFHAIGAALRDVMDYDILDERLIEDGGLARYRVLVWLEGTYIEAPVMAKLTDWVRGGGVLVKLGATPPTTVEGDQSPGQALLEAAGKVSIVGDGNMTDTMQTARVLVQAIRGAGPAGDAARDIDLDWDGVYTTLLANGEVILFNSTKEERTKQVAGHAVVLPPVSIRSVLP
ncbi:MAG: family 14 glycosylhydrolase [Armatimonadetes bacterium]|nr:family 14 glycosylhydrolase [Armatimonadota bacterium]